MLLDVSTQSRDIQNICTATFKKATTTQLSRKSEQKVRLPLIHVAWPNNDKVIKSTAPEDCVNEKYPSLQAMWSLIK